MAKESSVKRYLLIAFVIGVVIGAALCRRSTHSVTLGHLAQKTTNLQDHRIIVSNATGGTRHGRFILFRSTVSTRYHVLIVLRDGEEDLATGRYEAYCYGVVDHDIPGSPVAPPVVYLFDGHSVP